MRKAGPGKERAILVVRLATGEIDLVALGCWPNPHANAGKETGIIFFSRLEPRTSQLGCRRFTDCAPGGLLEQESSEEGKREEEKAGSN